MSQNLEYEKDVLPQPTHHETYDLEDGKSRHLPSTEGMDDAAQILRDAGGQRDFSAQERKRVLRKIDLFVCVPMCLVYFLQLCDKSALSYAAVFDLTTSNHLVGTQYSWLNSCVYFAQLAFQPLSSYALIVFPGKSSSAAATHNLTRSVKYWVMFNFISWSCITVVTAAAHNLHGFAHMPDPPWMF